MKKYVIVLLKKLTTALELIISGLLALGIILLLFRLAGEVVHVPDLNVYPNYDDLLETCFNLVIGVELIRMLYSHKPSTVFEVLLFAIARQIIIDHSSPVNSLIGVIAIAGLFATRKFLFYDFEEAEKIIFRATQKAYNVNHLIHMNIPHEENDTLRDVVLRKLREDKADVGVGACAYFSDCGLRVAKMYNGEISRIEVIRALK